MMYSNSFPDLEQVAIMLTKTVNDVFESNKRTPVNGQGIAHQAYEEQRWLKEERKTIL